MLEGLDKAGFEVYKGIDNGGISRLYYTRGGGYYIDVGASKHIIDGNIKVHKSPEGIKGFKSHELELADGKKLDADFVVLATGFDNMRTTVRKVLGDKVADRCKDVWDLDEEGELQAVRIPQVEYVSCDIFTNRVNRYGDPLDTPTFGTWAAILRCAASTPSSWHCRSRLLNKD